MNFQRSFGGNLISVLLWLICTSLFLHCSRNHPWPSAEDRAGTKESLVRANKEMVRIEAEQIEDYIRRRHLDMKSSGSGLRYRVDGKGYGIKPEAGDRVSLLYTVELLTGDTIYSSDQDGPLTFRAGRAEVISGLEEGILLMKEGDQAKFIIPSHLAYGLTGDQKKIRDKVTLVYDIKLLSVGKVH